MTTALLYYTSKNGTEKTFIIEKEGNIQNLINSIKNNGSSEQLDKFPNSLTNLKFDHKNFLIANTHTPNNLRNIQYHFYLNEQANTFLVESTKHSTQPIDMILLDELFTFTRQYVAGHISLGQKEEFCIELKEQLKNFSLKQLNELKQVIKQEPSLYFHQEGLLEDIGAGEAIKLINSVKKSHFQMFLEVAKKTGTNLLLETKLGAKILNFANKFSNDSSDFPALQNTNAIEKKPSNNMKI